MKNPDNRLYLSFKPGQALLALLASLILLPLNSLASQATEHMLDNGLKVIVKEDHRAPVIVFQIWYKVGSSYEPPGKTGISHVLEHMMFKGTHKVAAGELSEIVSRFGGKDNAFTSKDYTGYYQMFEASRLPLSFELEADRMVNLKLLEEEFQKERQVVMEERRTRVEDKPTAKAHEHFITSAYSSSPYQQPVIGWMHDLEQLTLEDLEDWYHKWYAPNNATIVVAGDVKSDEVLALAKKYFGHLPASDIPRTAIPRQVSPLGERRSTLYMPVQVPTLYMGYNVPALSTAEDPKEMYALEVLAAVLDGGYSARIESRIVRRDRIAASAGAGFSPFSRGDTLFMFTGIPASDHNLEDLENAFVREIEDLANTPPTKEELDVIQAQMISGLVYQKDSLYSQANQIGLLETIGYSWRDIETHLDKIKSVTPEEVSAAARKFLVNRNRVIAQILPQAQEPSKTEEGEQSSE